MKSCDIILAVVEISISIFTNQNNDTAAFAAPAGLQRRTFSLSPSPSFPFTIENSGIFKNFLDRLFITNIVWYIYKQYEHCAICRNKMSLFYVST